MTYKLRYLPQCLKDPFNPSGQGMHPDPANWTEAAQIQRDTYYGYLKHKAQARFRGEDHSLTKEEWFQLWPKEKWVLRGRDKDSLCLCQQDPAAGWHLNNVEVVPRTEYLRRNKEYRAKRNGNV